MAHLQMVRLWHFLWHFNTENSITVNSNTTPGGLKTNKNKGGTV